MPNFVLQPWSTDLRIISSPCWGQFHSFCYGLCIIENNLSKYRYRLCRHWSACDLDRTKVLNEIYCLQTPLALANFIIPREAEGYIVLNFSVVSVRLSVPKRLYAHLLAVTFQHIDTYTI